MEFAILKWAVVLLQRGKKTRWEGIQLPNGEEIGEADTGGCKYLGVLELDKLMFDESKRKGKKIYHKRITLLIMQITLALIGKISSIKHLGYICNKI